MKQRFLVVLSLFFLLFFIKDANAIIYVPQNFSSIQDAINNASDFETILISSGQYNESIVVDKPLSLIGLGNVTIYGANYIYLEGYPIACYVRINENDVKKYNVSLRGDVLTINSDNVLVENITFSHSRGYYSDAGIFINSSKNITIKNVSVNESCYGIYIFNSSLIDIENYVSYLMDYGIKIASSKLVSISNSDSNFYIYNSQNITLDQSKGMNKTKAYGILAVNSNKNIFKNSNFTNNWNGIKLIRSHDNLLKNLVVRANPLDLVFISSGNNSVENCTFDSGIDIDGVIRVNVTRFKFKDKLNEPSFRLSDYLEITVYENMDNRTAKIRIYYNKTKYNELNLTPENLTIYFFNETSNQWEAVNTTVNEEEGWAEAIVSHFSIWMVGVKKIRVAKTIETKPIVSSSYSSGSSGSFGYVPIVKKNETKDNVIIEKEYLDCENMELPNGSICNSSGIYVPIIYKEIEKKVPVIKTLEVEVERIPNWAYLSLIINFIFGVVIIWLVKR